MEDQNPCSQVYIVSTFMLRPIWHLIFMVPDVLLYLWKGNFIFLQYHYTRCFFASSKGFLYLTLSHVQPQLARTLRKIWPDAKVFFPLKEIGAKFYFSVPSLSLMISDNETQDSRRESAVDLMQPRGRRDSLLIAICREAPKMQKANFVMVQTSTSEVGILKRCWFPFSRQWRQPTKSRI